jgi:hypothetical protein
MVVTTQTTIWQHKINWTRFHAMRGHLNCLIHILKLLFRGSEERMEGRNLAKGLFRLYLQSPEQIQVFGSVHDLNRVFMGLLPCWLGTVILLDVNDYEGCTSVYYG